jgi:ketosteroid isomerase-like protein
MGHIGRSLLITLLALAMASLAAATGAEKATAGESNSADRESEIPLITKMEEDRVLAGVRKDVSAIAAVTGEDYMQIDLDGNVRDKAAALRRIESTGIQLRSNSVDEMVVRIFGDTALVTGRSNPKGVIDGKEFPPIRYSRVYVKRGGHWQVVMFQMTRIAESSAR